MIVRKENQGIFGSRLWRPGNLEPFGGGPNPWFWGPRGRTTSSWNLEIGSDGFLPRCVHNWFRNTEEWILGLASRLAVFLFCFVFTNYAAGAAYVLIFLCCLFLFVWSRLLLVCKRHYHNIVLICANGCSSIRSSSNSSITCSSSSSSSSTICRILVIDVVVMARACQNSVDVVVHVELHAVVACTWFLRDARMHALVLVLSGGWLIVHGLCSEPRFSRFYRYTCTGNLDKYHTLLDKRYQNLFGNWCTMYQYII